MKGIKKTLMAGAFACAAFNVQAEVQPFSYGIKVGPSLSPIVGYDKGVKIGNKEATHSFFDTPFVFGNIYSEYAFTDHIGMGLEVGYMKQGATLTGRDENKKEQKEEGSSSTTAPSISIVSHGIAVPLHLCIYPLGREEEDGVLRVMVGGSLFVPLGSTYKSDDKEIKLTSEQEKQEPGVDIALAGGIGYELPNGLSFEARYSYGLMNRLPTEKDKEQTIFNNATGLKKLNIQTATIGVGYNLGFLFE